MNCPDCDRPLPASAVNCRCGWKKPADHAAVQRPVREAIPCRVTEGCREPAIMRRRMPGGQMVESCFRCDKEQASRDARESLEARGLTQRPGESKADYAARLRAWLKDRVNGIVRRQPEHQVRERQPGEDENFDASGLSRASNVNGAFTGPAASITEQGGPLPG